MNKLIKNTIIATDEPFPSKQRCDRVRRNTLMKREVSFYVSASVLFHLLASRLDCALVFGFQGFVVAVACRCSDLFSFKNGSFQKRLEKLLEIQELRSRRGSERARRGSSVSCLVSKGLSRGFGHVQTHSQVLHASKFLFEKWPGSLDEGV